jgi:GT2 family glycosyltransferase
MNKKIAVIISPNWKDYAQKYLADSLTSLANQDYVGKLKFWLVDNATTAESFLLMQKFGQEYLVGREWVLLANKNNDGFAKGNNGAMRMAMDEGYDYVVLFNIDGVADKACLRELVEVIESDTRIGAVQGRIMLSPEIKKINSLGNVTHFLGFGYSGHCGEELEDYSKFNLTPIAYPSGATVLFKASTLKQVGLFDEEFWMYNEDQDLGWRLWLAGFKVVLASSAVFYHQYELNRSSTKYYWMDRNRLLAIFKNYHLATLVLIAPALVAVELGLIIVAIRDGWFKEKLRVWLYFLSPLTWLYLTKARRESQSLRKVSDRQIIKLFSGKIVFEELNGPLLKLANFFLNIYWNLVKIIILW